VLSLVSLPSLPPITSYFSLLSSPSSYYYYHHHHYYYYYSIVSMVSVKVVNTSR